MNEVRELWKITLRTGYGSNEKLIEKVVTVLPGSILQYLEAILSIKEENYHPRLTKANFIGNIENIELGG